MVADLNHERWCTVSWELEHIMIGGYFDRRDRDANVLWRSVISAGIRVDNPLVWRWGMFLGGTFVGFVTWSLRKVTETLSHTGDIPTSMW